MNARKLIIGNWKMNLNASQASILVHRLHERIRIHRDVEIVLAPSALHLQPLSVQIDRRKFRLAAQNAYYRDDGPFTGEISFTMLRDLTHYVIIGHSERRRYFNESLDMIRDKVAACVRNGMMPVLCVGETKTERSQGETKQVLHDQLTTALSNLTGREVAEMVIAYEPVWALSDGSNYRDHDGPSPAVLAETVDFIRQQVDRLYGPKVARRVRVLYGGSCNSANARGYLDTPGVDGLLVGGASLNYDEFSAIVDAAYRSLFDKEQ